MRNYDNEMEFLIRCTGLSGNFRIVRYRLERENILARLNERLEAEKIINPRRAFINRAMSGANISISNKVSSDALSVRTIFKGIGAELILIDKMSAN